MHEINTSQTFGDTVLASGVPPIVYVKSYHFCFKWPKSHAASGYKIDSKRLNYPEKKLQPQAPV